MKRIVGIVSIVLMLCTAFLFGCDPYAKMKLTLSESEIVFDLSNEETGANEKTVLATVSGVSGKVSKHSNFTTQDSNISISQFENGKNTGATITAVSSGTATVKVTSEEGNKTKYINIVVKRTPTSLSARATYKPAVSIGTTTSLDLDEALKFSDGATEKDVTLSLKESYSGVSVSGNALTVGNTIPSDRKVTIIATSKANAQLKAEFDVYVVEAIKTLSQITFNSNAISTDSEQMQIEINKQAIENVTLNTTINSTTTESVYYNFTVESLNTNVLSVEKVANKTNEFVFTGIKTGSANVKVTIFINGFDSKYANYSFTTLIVVKNVPKTIQISSKSLKTGIIDLIADSGVSSTTPEVFVYDTYADGVVGTHLSAKIAEDVLTADSYLKISGTALEKVAVYDGTGTEIEDLTRVNNALSIYLKVKDGIAIDGAGSYTLTFVSLYDESVKQSLTITISKGINTLKEENSKTTIAVKKGEQTNLNIVASAIDNSIITANLAQISVDLGAYGSNYISIARPSTTSANFVLTGNATGTCEIYVLSENGKKLTLQIVVYVPLTSARVYFDTNNTNIAKDYSEDENGNVTNVTFAKGTKHEVLISSNEGATISSTKVESGNSLIIAVFNKTHFDAIQLTETAVQIKVTIIGYTEDGEEQKIERTFSASVYIPLNQIQLSANSLTLKDYNSVGYLNIGESLADLKIYLSPSTATNFTVSWQSSDSNVLEILETNKVPDSSGRVVGVRIQAKLAKNENNRIAYITCTILQNGRTYTQSCAVTIEPCEMVEDISISNVSKIEIYDNNNTPQDATDDFEKQVDGIYFSATNGLYNKTELEKNPSFNNYFNIQATALKSTAYNKNLIYIAESTDEFGCVKATQPDKQVAFVNSSGRVYANSSGYARITIIPECYISGMENGNYTFNAAYAKYVYVFVADGQTKESAIRISNVNELLSINTANGLALHYKQTENIDVSSVSAFAPFGTGINGTTITEFTGSYNGNGHTISNLNLKMANADGKLIVGLFASASDISDLTLTINSISSLSSSGNNEYEYVAGLVAINNGTISGCHVEFKDITIKKAFPNCALTFGAVCALNESGKTIKNCESSGDVTFDFSEINTEVGSYLEFAVGGIVGNNKGTIQGSANGISGDGSGESYQGETYNFSNVSSLLNIQIKKGTNTSLNENIGGIVGINTSAISNCSYAGVIFAYDNLGGISSTNSGAISNCFFYGNLYGTENIGGIAGNLTAGTISACGVENYQTTDKTKNHTMIVGTNCVGGVVGNRTGGRITSSYIASFYTMICASYTSIENANYVSDNVYYGDVLVLGNGENYAWLAGKTAEGVSTSDLNNWCNAYINSTTKLSDGTSTIVVPTDIVSTVKNTTDTTFSDSATKISDKQLILPYFEYVSGGADTALFTKNTHKISDLISTSVTAPTSENVSKKFYVTVLSGTCVSIDKSGNLHVVGTGKATIEISSIYNSSNTQTIEIACLRPIGTMTVNYNNTTLRKGESITFTISFEYKDSNNVSYVCNQTTLTSVSSANEDVSKVEDVATVSGNVITGNNQGTSVITVSASVENPFYNSEIMGSQKNLKLSPAYTKTQTITVNQGATDVVFGANNVEINQTDVLTFNVFVKTDFDESAVGYSGEGTFTEILKAIKSSNDINISFLSKEKQGEYIKFTFATQLINMNSVLTEDKTYTITFSDSTLFETGSTTKKTFDFKFTVKPTEIIRIDGYHYVGVTDKNSTITYDSEDLSSSITPGQLGILEVDLYPYFADFDTVTIVNDSSNSADLVTFEQIIMKSGSTTGEYVALFPRMEYLEKGISLARKSVYTESGNEKTYSFNGKFYLKTLIKSGVTDLTEFKLILTATKGDNVVSTTITLYTVLKPTFRSITYSYYLNGTLTNVSGAEKTEDSDIIYIAQGTTGNAFVADYAGYSGNTVWSSNASGVTVGANNVLKVDDSVALDTTAILTATITKIVNGITETDTRYFKVMVVDCVLNKPDVSGAESGSMVLKVGNAIKLALSTSGISGTTIALDSLSKNINYWILNDSDLNNGLSETEGGYYYNSNNVFRTEKNSNNVWFIRAMSRNSSQTISCKFSYYYDNNGKLNLGSNSLYSTLNVNTSFATAFYLETDEDAPQEITTQAEFEAMEDGTHYILMNDLTLETYSPMIANFESFDGNGYNITISGFDISKSTETDSYTDSVDVGLFKSVSEGTVVKNVKVKYAQNFSLNITSEYQKYRSINFGTITAVNNGIITNATVSFETNSEVNFEIVSNNLEAGDLASNVGGLIGVNYGFITNSKVECATNLIESTILSTNTCTSATIKAAGNLAGLVAVNYGKISSCMVENVNLTNTGLQSSTTNSTGGLVGTNSSTGEIAYSYIDGKKTGSGTIRTTDNKIVSNGQIGGFVYENAGYITNCYANIKLVSNSKTSGFVFDNLSSNANIEDCYTLCDIEQNSLLATPFVGTDSTSVLSNVDSIYQCYYLIKKSGETFGNTTGQLAYAINEDDLKETSTFSAYVFAPDAENELAYSWVMGSYPKLTVASSITFSQREIIIKTGDTVVYGNVLKTPSEGKSETFTTQINSETTVSLKVYNPILIDSAERYSKKVTENIGLIEPKTLIADLRIVADFEFDESVVNSIMSDITYKGTFDGNGMVISNIRVNTETASKETALGFIKEITKQDTSKSAVKNLTLEFVEVYGNNIECVGALAGTISDTILNNITINGNDAVVVGKNIVGGVVGKITGNSMLYNIFSNISVSSEFRSGDSYNFYNGNNDSSVGYAGGIAGVIDVSKGDGCDIERAEVNGLTYIIGENAGGIFGYVGANTFARNLNFTVDYTYNYINASYSAGGLVSENHGRIERSTIVNNAQTSIDSSTVGTISSLANINFFKGAPAYAGGLVGRNLGGEIVYSYSKIDVRGLEIGTAGGLVGYAESGEISNCYASGSVKAKSTGIVGGLVGEACKTTPSTDPTEVLNIEDCAVVNNWFSTDLTYITNALGVSGTSFKFGYVVGCVNNESNIMFSGINTSIKEIESSTLNLIGNSNAFDALFTATKTTTSDLLAQSNKNDAYKAFSSSVWQNHTSDSTLRYPTLVKRSNYVVYEVDTYGTLKNTIKQESNATIKLVGNIDMTNIKISLPEFKGTLTAGKDSSGNVYRFYNYSININSKSGTGAYAGIFKITTDATFNSIIVECTSLYVDCDSFASSNTGVTTIYAGALVGHASNTAFNNCQVIMQGQTGVTTISSTTTTIDDGGNTIYQTSDGLVVKCTNSSITTVYAGVVAGRTDTCSFSNATSAQNTSKIIEMASGDTIIYTAQAKSNTANFNVNVKTNFGTSVASYVGGVVGYSGADAFTAISVGETGKNITFTQSKTSSGTSNMAYLGGLVGYITSGAEKQVSSISVYATFDMSSYTSSEKIAGVVGSINETSPTFSGLTIDATVKTSSVGAFCGVNASAVSTKVTGTNTINANFEIDYTKKTSYSASADTFSLQKISASSITTDATINGSASYKVITDNTKQTVIEAISGDNTSGDDISDQNYIYTKAGKTEYNCGSGGSLTLRTIYVPSDFTLTEDSSTENSTIKNITVRDKKIIIPTEIGGKTIKDIANNFAENIKNETITSIVNENNTNIITNNNSGLYTGTTLHYLLKTASLLKDGTTSIDAYAGYNNTGLAGSLTINNVTTIGESAFSGCTNLTTISASACTTVGKKAIPSSVTNLTIGVTDNTNLANAMGGDGVTALTLSKLTSVTSEMFINSKYSNLTNLTLSAATTIEANAFSGCTNLESFNLSSVTTLGASAFQNCSSLETVTTNNNLSIINENTFNGCTNLATFTGNAVASVGTSAFSGCEKLVTFSANACAVVNNNAFSGCTNLASFNLSSVTTLGAGAFQNCSSLNSVTISSSLKTISENTFNACTKLASFTGNALTTIGTSAFNGCTSLKKFNSSIDGTFDLSSITTLGAGAFQNCSSLISVTTNSALTTINENTFNGCTLLSGVNKTENANYLPSIITIGQGAFSGCNQLGSVLYLTDSEQIGQEAFKECSDLQTIVFVAGEESRSRSLEIGKSAFSECEKLQSLIIFQQVNNDDGGDDDAMITKIGESAFNDCTNLTTVGSYTAGTAYLKDLRQIDANAFYGCTKLTTFSAKACTTVGTDAIPSSITNLTIGVKTAGNLKNAISLCKNNLTMITLPDIQEIGEYAFYGCTSLSKFNSNTAGLFDLQNVTTIGANAFRRCTKLITLTGNSITEIGESAFNDCTNLTTFSASACTTVGTNAIPNSVINLTVGVTDSTNLANAIFNCKGSLITFNLPQADSFKASEFTDCDYISNLWIKKINLLELIKLKKSIKSIRVDELLVEETSYTYNTRRNTSIFVNQITYKNITYNNMYSLFCYYKDREKYIINGPDYKTAIGLISVALCSNGTASYSFVIQGLSSINYLNNDNKGIIQYSSSEKVKWNNSPTSVYYNNLSYTIYELVQSGKAVIENIENSKFEYVCEDENKISDLSETNAFLFETFTANNTDYYCLSNDFVTGDWAW